MLSLYRLKQEKLVSGIFKFCVYAPVGLLHPSSHFPAKLLQAALLWERFYADQGASSPQEPDRCGRGWSLSETEGLSLRQRNADMKGSSSLGSGNLRELQNTFYINAKLHKI